MTRESTDELDTDGTVKNGYDYNLQNWVVDGVLVDCGQAQNHWGKRVKDVPGHEVREVRALSPQEVEAIFTQSKVNGGCYLGDRLKANAWSFPTHTWFQNKMKERKRS